MHETDLVDESRPKYYLLTMYPYPSGDLHIGHWYIVTPSDALARFRRMHGYNVFFPIGFDAFGLPAENAAIKSGGHPFTGRCRTSRTCAGSSGRWVRRSPGTRRSSPPTRRTTCGTSGCSCSFLEAGLAYRAMSAVDWCPNDGTLAREQVEGRRASLLALRRARSRSATSSSGSCARRRTPTSCSTSTGLDWPEPIKIQQTNWIGRSEGAEIDFEVAPDEHQPGGDRLRVFTTRPDTLFGATFMVLAPEHPLVATLTASRPSGRGRGVRRAGPPADRDRAPVDRSREDRRRAGRRRDQPGQRRADPDLHRRLRAGRLRDRRDHGRPRARRARLRVRQEVRPGDPAGRRGARRATPTRRWTAPTSPTPAGEVLVNSGPFSGMPADEGGAAIVASLAEAGRAEPKVTYRLRDWLISRQRYWGTPIPIIYCERDGDRAGPDEQLPVRLPETVDYAGSGDNPLNHDEAFLQVTCPRCGGPARRETDTMDTFIDSSWYWFRYLSPHEPGGPVDREMTDRWTPVDQYTGGAEHAVMHLLYSRVLYQGDGRHRPRHATASRSSGCSTRARSWAPTASGCPSRAATSRIPTSWSPLRRRHRPAVPDVHGSLGPGWAVEPDRDRWGPSLPEPRLDAGARSERARAG